MPLPLIELDLLKTIVAIANTGNFSAAADAVGRTPSAISMQVKKMEELVGRQLFIRQPRSALLNEDGHMLVAHARRVLAMNSELVSRFIAPDVTGIVRLGAIDHAVDQIVPTILREFSQSHPNIRVDVMVENSEPQEAQFRKGEIDIGLVTCTETSTANLGVEHLYSERLVWAGLKGGIAAEQVPLPVSVWEEGCVWRASALDGLDKQNRDYRITFKSPHMAGQKAGILADLAIAPLPLSSCIDPIVVIDHHHDLPDLGCYSLGMLVRADAEPHVGVLADHIRSHVARIGVLESSARAA